MKHICIFILVTTLFGACALEEGRISEIDTRVESRQSVADYTNQSENYIPSRSELISCYNSAVRDGELSFHERFGEFTSKYIEYQSEELNAIMWPLFVGSSMENILLMSDNSYFLIRGNKEVQNGEAIRAYGSLFLLSKDDFEVSNTIALDDDLIIVSNDLGGLKIYDSNAYQNPANIYGKADSSGPCDTWPDEWVEIYLEYLGIPIPSNPEIPPVISISTMHDIIVEITDGECVCPHPCLIMEAITNSTLIDDASKRIVKQKWVEFEYGLDQFLVGQMEEELLDELVFFNCTPTVIIDPCSGVEITDSEISTLVSSNLVLTLDELYDELDKEEKIINRLTDPRLRCIYKFLALGTDAVFCNTFENFIGDTEINISLQNSEQVIGLGLTTPYYLTPNSPYENVIDIALNQNQLEGLCEVSVACTFLHEGIHAEMFRLLNDDSIDPEDFPEIWDEYDINISQHDNMAEAYISLLSDALKEKYGDRYTDEEYEAIAWLGLGDVNGEDVNTSAWNDLTQAEQTNLQQVFSNVNSDCSADSCK